MRVYPAVFLTIVLEENNNTLFGTIILTFELVAAIVTLRLRGYLIDEKSNSGFRFVSSNGSLTKTVENCDVFTPNIYCGLSLWKNIYYIRVAVFYDINQSFFRLGRA